MLPGIELMACPDLAVPREVMHHVVQVESSYNPYAIGVVGGRLLRQPRNLPEAVSTARMLEQRGYNFSLGLAQVNRYNMAGYGLASYEEAFQACANLQAGSRILAECYNRSRDWGKSFSCYYSGDFSTGYRHGYVQKIYASIRRARGGQVASNDVPPIPVVGAGSARKVRVASGSRAPSAADTLMTRRGMRPANAGAAPATALPQSNAALAAAVAASPPPGLAALPATPMPVLQPNTAPVVVAATHPGAATVPVPAAGRADDSAFVF